MMSLRWYSASYCKGNGNRSCGKKISASNAQKFIQQSFKSVGEKINYMIKQLLRRWRKIMFKDKVLLITGGTGSFGNAVLKRFLETDIKEIRIFSRDEKAR
jgi:FlaA1/EpsC-like NDP-sugar epimerase